MSAPIIVTAQFAQSDFAWLNALRREHFPAQRNQVDAHLTLFHHLAPSLAPELKRRLADASREPPPAAAVSGLINLGRGVAIRIESEGLEAIRADLAGAFAGALTPQDAAAWRPHVTIQNKVRPDEAMALYRSLAGRFDNRSVSIRGLAAWWYRGGPWEPLSTHPFRGQS